MKHLSTLILALLIIPFGFAQSSLMFDGTNDKVEVPKNENLQATSAMTIEAWINAEEWQSALYKGSVVSNSNNIGSDNGFDLRAAANGKAEFNVSINGAWVYATTEEFMEVGTWYHLAGVYDGSRVRIYINGIERASNDASGDIGDFRGNFQIGSCPGWGGRLFNGKIDEVRFWNVARTTDEIRASINTELNGDETGLTGYWKFNEGSGDVAGDSSPNGFDGTLLGMDPATAWVENFECPFTDPDVGPSALLTPLSSSELGANETVSISITNYSVAEIGSFDVSYKINDGNTVTQTFEEGLAALETAEFTFDGTADLSEEGLYEFEIITHLNGDAHPENDVYNATVNHFSADDNFAVEFDGANDYIRIPDHDAFDFSEALTLEAWIKATAWKDQAWLGSIISKDADQGGMQTGYVMRAGKNGTLNFVATPGWDELSSGEYMQLNKWYHLAAVYADGVMKIYINGALIGQKNHEGPINANTMDLLLGESTGFSGRFWQGMIDEVRIWNTGRTMQEIKEHIATELEGNEEGLVAYYPMNDGLGSTTIEDKTGNGHLGTLTNLDTETCWVAGYQPTSNDIGVQAIVSPASGPAWKNDERVKTVITNHSMTAAENFDISYQINDGDVVTEHFDAVLEPSTSMTFAFKTLEDLSSLDEAEIKVYTSLENDTDLHNDTLINTITKGNTISIFHQKQHNFGNAGQVQSRIMSLPHDNSAYSNILLHINLECPEFGCDPWDQPAFLKLKKDGMEYEIGRYITPFGVACGPWTIDVSDFRSVLRDDVEFISYVQVWGASGWLVSLDLEFVEGTPDYQYTQLIPLWNTDYQVYGDPDISYDMPEINVPVAANAEGMSLRLTTTGHGQGNTDNAAEFAHKTHHIHVNGTETYEQDLWKDDCNVNPCSPQNGTWTFARAGWCPGQEVIPNHYDLTDVMTAGENMQLDYVFEEYTNLLNTGYNGGSHTEPHFRVHSYLIQGSSQPLGKYLDVAVEDLTAPVSSPNLGDNEAITVLLKNNGNEAISDFEVSYRIDEGDIVTETVTETIEAGGSLEYTFVSTANMSEEQWYNIFLIATMTDDEVPANDYYVADIEHQPVGISSYEIQPVLELLPNPAKSECTVRYEGPDQQVHFELADMQGRKIQSQTFNSKGFELKLQLDGLRSGIYFVRISGAQGVKIEKLIVE